MEKKLTDSKTVEKLALIAVAKAGDDANIAEVTRKVISDYLCAKDTLKQYNESVVSRKAALKLVSDKKQDKPKKAVKAKKKTAGE